MADRNASAGGHRRGQGADPQDRSRGGSGRVLPHPSDRVVTGLRLSGAPCGTRQHLTGTLVDPALGSHSVCGSLAEDVAEILAVAEECGPIDRSHRKLAHIGSYEGVALDTPASPGRSRSCPNFPRCSISWPPYARPSALAIDRSISKVGERIRTARHQRDQAAPAQSR